MKLPELKLNRTHALLLGCCVLLFVGWRVYSTLHPTVTEGHVIPVVRTVTIGETDAEITASYPGEVRGRYESTLAFQAAGKIVGRHVNLGDRVQAGQLLMELDPRDIQQNVTMAQAAVLSAQSNYKLAKDNYERYKNLYSKGAVSSMARDQYKTQYEAAEASLQSAVARLTASQNQLGYTRLTADHDGSIAALTGEIGQIVAAGTPVVTLIRDGQREIRIFVPENRLNQIHPGQKARITFWALQNQTAEGSIREIAPMADSATRTYKVTVAVENMPAEARPGMTATVLLETGAAPAVLVPAGAIYQTGSQTQVWVIREKKAVLINVQTGSYEGNSIQVLRGLQKGDVVVTGGINKLTEGQEVRLEGSEFK